MAGGRVNASFFFYALDARNRLAYMDPHYTQECDLNIVNSGEGNGMSRVLLRIVSLFLITFFPFIF